jgi:hypothetical protein
MPYPSTQSNIVLGPVAVVVGANRHKIPASPYRSKSNYLPVDQVAQDGAAFFRTQIFTPDNNPLNIVDMKLRYVVRESLFNENYTEIDVTVIRSDYGEIEIYIPPNILSDPGLHLASIQVYNLDGKLIYQTPRYLEITPKISSINRPVTVAEIRMALRDYPESNTLLNDVEFSDNEIAFCITRPIDAWNSMSPDVGQYDIHNFPWRRAHINATIGELMKIASYHYFRNQLPYSSGGLSVDDKNKGATYLQMAEQELAKFQMFCQEKKFEINIMGGFAWLPGPYDQV